MDVNAFLATLGNLVGSKYAWIAQVFIVVLSARTAHVILVERERWLSEMQSRWNSARTAGAWFSNPKQWRISRWTPGYGFVLRGD